MIRRVLVVLALAGAGLFFLAAVWDVVQIELPGRRRFFVVMDIMTAVLFATSAVYLERGVALARRRAWRVAGRAVQVVAVVFALTQVVAWARVSTWGTNSPLVTLLSLPVLGAAGMAAGSIWWALREAAADGGLGMTEPG